MARIGRNGVARIGRNGVARARATAVAVFTILSLAIASPAGAALSNTSDATWMTNDQVTAMVRIGNTIYLGGNFTSVRSRNRGGESVERRYLAAFDANTGDLVRSWAPRASARVFAMVTDGATIYIGGRFRNVNGVSRDRLAALDPATGGLRSWAPRVSGAVRALDMSGGHIFAGGGFLKANGQPRTRLAAFSASTGALRSNWQPSANDVVRAIAVRPDGNRVFLGGAFTSINQTSGSFIKAVDVTAGSVVSWGGNSAAVVYDLEVGGGRVYAARGGGGGRVTAFRDDTGGQVWWHAANGDVQALHYAGDDLFVGGHFALQGTCKNCRAVAFAGEDINTHLAKVASANGALDRGFTPVFNGFPGVWTILSSNNQLHVGGSFKKAGGRLQQGYARFTD